MLGTIIRFLFNWVKTVITGALTHPLATLTFLVGLGAGMAATGTWIGEWIGKILTGLTPDEWYAPQVLFAILSVAVIADLAREGIAERFANYGILIGPSIGMAIPKDAKLHEVLAGWIDDFNGWLDHNVGEWIIGGSAGQHAVMTVFALFGILFVAWYHEWHSKGRTFGSRTGGGTGTTTTTTTTGGGTMPKVSRRPRVNNA